MKKEDISLAMQLLNSMLEGVDRLEIAQKKKDLAEFNSAKKAILLLQKELDKII